MWTWIMRIIAALLAALGAGLFASTVRALRHEAERLFNIGLPASVTILAIVLVAVAAVIAASPAARTSLRQ